MKTKRNKGYSKKKQKEVAAKISELIGQHYTDDEICKKMNMQRHVYQYYRTRVSREFKEKIMSMTPESVLFEYAQSTMGMIHDLNDVKEGCARSSGPKLAMVQAIRLQHRLQNDVIKLARKLNLVSSADKTITVGDTRFRYYTNVAIRKAVDMELANFC